MPKGLVSSPRDEELWSKATAAAEKQGKSKNYAYINGIYQKMKGNTKTASLLHAISSLEIARDNVDTNAPINEAEGDFKQAELDRSVSRSCGNAINLLFAIQKHATKASVTPILDGIQKHAISKLMLGLGAFGAGAIGVPMLKKKYMGVHPETQQLLEQGDPNYGIQSPRMAINPFLSRPDINR